jgi:hypothetical protein
VQSASNTYDPLKARVQSVLGQFDIVRPLLNEGSVGVPLAPMTPIGAQNAMPLLRIPDGRTSASGSSGVARSAMHPPPAAVAKQGDRLGLSQCK